jgi:HAD superfamily hydrolase (TIGR01509 family)
MKPWMAKWREAHGGAKVAMKVIAVGFDFDHTLGVDNRLERTVALELLGPGQEQAVDAALATYRSGASSYDDAIATLGLEPNRFQTLVVERAPEFVRPLPGCAEALRELRLRAVPTAILSNGWSPLQEVKARLVGFEGPVLVSDRLGVRKPDRTAFMRLQHVLGAAPERIAYVGDDPVADVGGALAAGMQALWFDWEGHTYPQEIGAPTARITALTDILRFVQGPLSPTANPPA